MRKILLYITAMLAGVALNACLGNSVEDKYKTWREANDEWFELQRSNTKFYTTVTAPWDANAHILMHWYNDTMLTRHNKRPLFTSTVDVKYRGMTKDTTPFDSSYLNTSPGDSLMRTQISAPNLIEGWQVALPRMHVGDSCRIVIPYRLAYGSYEISDIIKPYTNLVFDVKLVSIYAYEVRE